MQTVSLLFHDVYAADPRESGFGSPAADRYKLSLGQFDEQLAGLALVRADAPVLASAGLTTYAKATVVRRSFTRRRKASGCQDDVPYLITVDDGGASYYTVVADRLEAQGWRGHCFVSTDLIGTGRMSGQRAASISAAASAASVLFLRT